MILKKSNNWEQTSLQVFWGEIAPCNHVLQIYENDKVFIESLEGFVGSGILAGEAVVVIATSEHLEALELRLKAHNFDLEAAKSDNFYIPLNAKETLSRFMINGWPEEDLFNEMVSEIISKAGQNGRKVRAFGEMVAILWAEGNNGATVRLEYLWNSFCQKQEFCLFCAYPKSGFTQDANESILNICKSHSKLIAGWSKPSTEIYFKAV